MADEEKKKKSRRDRQRELRELEGGGCGVKYDLVADRHLDDKRYERELEAQKEKEKQAAAAAAAAAKGGGGGAGAAAAPSATFDALIRMETGRPERSIADKINDPNRLSWEDYKQIKADKLDLVGADQRKMLEYRAQLDAEREARLAKIKGGGKDDKKKKKKKKRKRDDSSDDSDSDDSDSDSDSDDGSKKRKKKDK